jgi:hypothetical protein
LRGKNLEQTWLSLSPNKNCLLLSLALLPVTSVLVADAYEEESEERED